MNPDPAEAGRLVALVPVDQEPQGVGYKVIVLNGYRAGACLCHGDTDIPVVWPSAASASEWLKETGFKEVPLSEGMHDQWSVYRERSAQIGDAMIRWVEDSGAAYVIDIQAGSLVRGRQLLQWLSVSRQREIHAVGVVDAAQGFWDRMEEGDLIKSQTDEDFMSFFGRSGTTMRPVR